MADRRAEPRLHDALDFVLPSSEGDSCSFHRSGCVPKNLLIPVVLLALGAQAWVWKQVADERRERLRVEREIADFKAHVAAKYASPEMLERFETRLTDAINRLADRLDRVINR